MLKAREEASKAQVGRHPACARSPPPRPRRALLRGTRTRFSPDPPSAHPLCAPAGVRVGDRRARGEAPRVPGDADVRLPPVRPLSALVRRPRSLALAGCGAGRMRVAAVFARWESKEAYEGWMNSHFRVRRCLGFSPRMRPVPHGGGFAPGRRGLRDGYPRPLRLQRTSQPPQGVWQHRPTNKFSVPEDFCPFVQGGDADE